MGLEGPLEKIGRIMRCEPLFHCSAEVIYQLLVGSTVLIFAPVPFTLFFLLLKFLLVLQSALDRTDLDINLAAKIPIRHQRPACALESAYRLSVVVAIMKNVLSLSKWVIKVFTSSFFNGQVSRLSINWSLSDFSSRVNNSERSA